MSRRGGGHGWTKSLGDLRHFTTAAGRTWGIAGDGSRGRLQCALSMRQRLWHSLAEADSVSRFSFGSSFSGVAWYLPLGPRDVYVPSYRCSPRYVQNVNITNTRVINVTQVTNVYNTVYVNHDSSRVNYTYARNNSAVTAVSRDTFVGARSVRGNNVRVSAEQINQARVVDSAPIAPTRTSYVGASAKVSNNKPAVPFTQRRVVEQRTPGAQGKRGGQARNNPQQQWTRRRPAAAKSTTESAERPAGQPPAQRRKQYAAAVGATACRQRQPERCAQQRLPSVWPATV